MGLELRPDFSQRLGGVAGINTTIPWKGSEEDARRLDRRFRLATDPGSLSLAELREMADTENPETLHPLIEEMLRRLRAMEAATSPGPLSR